MIQIHKLIIIGFLNTLAVTTCAIFIGLLFGILVAFIRVQHDISEKTENCPKHKFLNFLFKVYVSVFRSTPTTLQLIIFAYYIFYGSNKFLTVIIAFGLQSGAYISEILRAAVLAVDPMQNEAAQILGFNHYQALKFVVFPQAIKNSILTLINEFCSLIKETSVAFTIGFAELTHAIDVYRRQNLSIFPYFIGAGLYMVTIFVVSVLAKRILSNYEKKQLAKELEPYQKKERKVNKSG